MIDTKNIKTAILLILMAVGSAAAQNTMTLKECMEYAISNSTKIKIQQAENDDLRITRRDAILSAFTPSVSGSVYAYSNFGRSIDPETNTYVSTTSFNNGYSLSAGISLFNGFQAVNNIKISKTAALMGVSKEQQIIDELSLATMQAYYNVAYYTELVEIIQESVSTAKDSYYLSQREEQLGRKSHADVVQIGADLADREYQLIVAQNSLEDAYITLKDVMFYPLDTILSIDTMQYSKWNLMMGNEIGEYSASAEIVNQAKHTLPSAQIAQGEMEKAKVELFSARWKLAPSLSLSAGWSSSYYSYPGMQGYSPTPFIEQFKNNSGEYIQLSLSIPIYDGLARHSNIGRKKNAYTRAVARYDQTMRDIEAEVVRAVADCNGASSAFVQSRHRAEAQQEAFALNKKKFEQGIISSIEYQTSSNNYLQSRAEQLNALFKFLIKKSVVNYYKGIPYIQQEY